MKAAGVIAEYNPLHNGHVYHLEQTRLLTGADAVVVAMSGNYVQRGEPAIMDKWVRTGNALRCGADLVIEIPTLFCLADAGQYASAAVKLLESTGKVTDISFGSESGDHEALSRIAKTLTERKEDVDQRIKTLRSNGLSYPAARSLAYSEVRAWINGTEPGADPQIKGDMEILGMPNDTLGIEYIRSMKTAKPVIVHREGAGYADRYDGNNAYQSASAIRAMTFDGLDVSDHVPESTAEALRTCHLTGPDRDKWFDALRYASLSADPKVLEDCPSGGEGLANLVKEAAYAADSWSSFIGAIKSKRYTYTRISRLCMQLILGITRSGYDITEPGYIRVLGFNEMGRELLSEIKEENCSCLPVVTNVNKSTAGLDERASKLLKLDIHASDIYNLQTDADMKEGSDHRHAPVIIK